MNSNGNKARRKKASPSKRDKELDSGSQGIILTQAEKELIVKACLKYRYTIPAYIKSRQPEVDSLDAIIDKLA